MFTIKEINRRIVEDFEYLTYDLNMNVVGVFLQGSQNYHLDYKGSDIDTKAIIIPKFEDIVLNKKPISKTLIKEDDSHLDVKDIRLMFDCFKKQNINFLEILFTEYNFIHVAYYDAFKPMLDNAEKIAHYNNYAAVNCLAGMVYEKYKALEHPYPTIKDKIEKYGYDSKQLHHILRCEEFMTRYVEGIPYKECLIPEDPIHLINVKKGCYNLEEVRFLAKESQEYVKSFKKDYMENNPCIIDNEVVEIMNKVLIDIFKISFKGDLL